MPSYSRGKIVLIRYPFSDLSGAKVRPAVVVSAPHASSDLIVVALTSRTETSCQASLSSPDGRLPA